MSSAATAQHSVTIMARISVGSSGASWQRSRPAGRPRSADMWNSAAIADWFVARTTRAATVTPSVALPPASQAERLAALLAVKWVVYAKPPFAGPEPVLAYLSRYTHRVAIANSRLTLLRA
jgi:hypothetical protein